VTTPPATSAEEPWPVRTVARKIAAWIERLGAVWVEGQLTQVTARPGSGTAFLVLRDPAADVSINLTAPTTMVRGTVPPLAEGARLPGCTAIAEIMSRDVISIGPDEHLSRAAHLMGTHKFSALPVVAEGRLLGSVTLTNVLDHCIDCLREPEGKGRG